MKRFLFEISLWFLIYYKQKLHQTERIVLCERKYMEETDVIGYSIQLIIVFANNLFSNLNLMGKIDNINLDMNSTTPLEHTFGRARIKVQNIHTIRKFIRDICFMNGKCEKRDLDEEKIKGRTSSFGVTVEDQNEDEFFFSSTPHDISMDFINLIFDKKNDNEYENLNSFIDFIRDFDESKNINHGIILKL